MAYHEKREKIGVPHCALLDGRWKQASRNEGIFRDPIATAAADGFSGRNSGFFFLLGFDFNVEVDAHTR